LSASADVLIYLAVLATLWIAYRIIRRHRRERSRPRLGDANAYEGNLLLPGESHHQPGGQKSHGSGYIVHGGGLPGHAGHAGHGTAGSSHH
jgi:hypothetical protein